jgi:hypothetical protein
MTDFEITCVWCNNELEEGEVFYCNNCADEKNFDMILSQFVYFKSILMSQTIDMVLDKKLKSLYRP